MDAAWWDEYDKLYYEIANLHYRIIHEQGGTYSIDDVVHVGEFMGKTSRILAAFRSRKDTTEDHNSVLATRWHTTRQGYLIGVVATCGAVGDWAAYTGIASGNDTKQDIRLIAENGAKLMREEAIGYFPWLAERPYRE